MRRELCREEVQDRQRLVVPNVGKPSIRERRMIRRTRETIRVRKDRATETFAERRVDRDRVLRFLFLLPIERLVEWVDGVLVRCEDHIKSWCVPLLLFLRQVFILRRHDLQ